MKNLFPNSPSKIWNFFFSRLCCVFFLSLSLCSSYRFIFARKKLSTFFKSPLFFLRPPSEGAPFSNISPTTTPVYENSGEEIKPSRYTRERLFPLNKDRLCRSVTVLSRDLILTLKVWIGSLLQGSWGFCPLSIFKKKERKWCRSWPGQSIFSMSPTLAHLKQTCRTDAASPLFKTPKQHKEPLSLSYGVQSLSCRLQPGLHCVGTATWSRARGWCSSSSSAAGCFFFSHSAAITRQFIA